ncbi:MAG: efflux RND transporter permease subunit [Nitrospinota bacterium]|nr:MAG: efflux RND transporter permease subunit [Nitrospinota bacterium]
MSLSRFAVQRPVTITMFFLAILVLGGISASRLPLDQLPDVTFPSVTVSTRYRGAAPDTVEKLVTEYIEKAVSTIDGVQEVRSVSKEENSTVVIDFGWDKDLTEAVNEVREKIASIKRFLPDEVEEPRIWKYDTSSQPIMYLSFHGDGERYDVRQIAEDRLAYLLQQVEGVAAVDVWGGKRRQIQVRLDQSRLEAVNLSLLQVVDALRQESLSLAGGRLEAGSLDYLVRPLGEFRSLQDIAHVVLTHHKGVPVYLQDVGQVVKGYENERTQTRINGEEGVILAVRKQSGGNTVQVADRVRARLPAIQQTLEAGLSLDILYDRSRFIKDSIRQVRNTAIQGGLIALLVLFLFLQNLRTSCIIALSMPISIIATFILLYLWDISLNWMSLGGLALGIGMLVDNSVVVLENIYRHRSLGLPAVEAAIRGGQEVTVAIAASTLTTLCVFLPIIFVQGTIGVIFRELALTVTASLLTSLGVALTLVPMLSARLMKSGAWGEEGRQRRRARQRLHALGSTYRHSLDRVLCHRGLVLAVAAGTLILASWGNRKIGSELLPAVDEGLMYGRLEMPVGTKFAITDGVMRQMERIIVQETPEIQAAFARVGVTSRGGGGTHTGFMFIKALDRTQREKSLPVLMQELRQRLKAIPGARIRIFERPSDLRRLWGGGRSERIEIDIQGYDLEASTALAHRLSQVLQQVEGVSHTLLSTEDQIPEIQVQIQRDKAAALGIRMADILNTVKTALEGTVATTYRDGGDQYDVLVRLQEQDREGWKDLEQLLIPTPTGRQVPLHHIATLIRARGPMTIERRAQQRVVTLQVASDGSRDFSSLVREIEERVRQVPLPQGLSLRLAGEREAMQQSRRDVVLAFTLALLLVYMVMASLYESLLHPLVIMFTIPFASIGIIASLWMTGTSYSVPVYIGIILLAGIVVNNGIVLIDYAQRLRQQGRRSREAIIEAGGTRLRPILITTLTTVLALFPLSVGWGEGAEVWAPLGRVVLGGLSVGTLFTLFFLPILYSLVEEMRERIWRWRGQKCES